MEQNTEKNDSESLGTGCSANDIGCCKVDAIVSIDSRGQIVLPKDVREKADISPGDKFVVVSMESGDQVCCLTLIKADHFADSVKGYLGPVIKEVL